MRTRRQRRKQKGGDVLPRDKGFFLGADIKHDFGESLPVPWYNIGGLPVVKSKSSSEIEVYTDFVTTRPDIENADARIKNKILFTLPEKTGVFKESLVPTIHPIGNHKVGIVFDAGKKLHTLFGAKNVITFGSVLDPALKPFDASDNPIWFQPDPNKFTVDLSNFGFDPTKITSLTVKDFIGSNVSAMFSLGTMHVDAVSTRRVEPDAPLTAKPINTSDISRAGFFTSIAKAGGTRDIGYYIGKTLGDMTLVASCMPTIGGNPNPYYGIHKSPWKTLEGDTTDETKIPEILVLTTIDRLNHTRAFMENVPSLFQHPGRAGAPRVIEFMPVNVSVDDISASIQTGYADLLVTSNKRYDDLIASLQETLDGSGRMESKYTTFTEDPVLDGKNMFSLEAAGKLIKEIVTKLDILKKIVAEWITKRRDDLTPEIKKYKRDCEIVQRISPQTTKIWYERAGEIRMSTKIVVAQVPKEGFGPDVPITVSLNIGLWNSLRRLQTIGEGEDYSTRVQNTDIAKTFLNPVKALPEMEAAEILAQMKSPPEEDAIRDYVDGILKLSRQTGGAPKRPISEISTSEPPKILDFDAYDFEREMPIAYAFGQYFTNKIGKKPEDAKLGEVLSVISKIYHSKTIFDPLWDELVKEVDTCIKAERFKIGSAESGTSREEILFYAFIHATNSENAAMFGFIGEDDNPIREEKSELVEYFRILENAFILESAKIEISKEPDAKEVRTQEPGSQLSTLPQGDVAMDYESDNGSQRSSDLSIVTASISQSRGESGSSSPMSADETMSNTSTPSRVAKVKAPMLSPSPADRPVSVDTAEKRRGGRHTPRKKNLRRTHRKGRK